MIRPRPLVLLAALGVAAALLLAACRGGRIRDRHDEQVLAEAENHHNLYRRDGDGSSEAVGIQRLAGTATATPHPEHQAIYTYSQAGLVREADATTPDADQQLAAMAIAWRDGPPILRFWQRHLNAKSIAFACPLDPYNTRPLPHDETGHPPTPEPDGEDGAREFEVFVSLRQGTLMPWVIQDDYEIFAIRVRHHPAPDDWQILAVRQLTDNRDEDVQPVLDPGHRRLAWTVLDGETPRVMLRDLGSGAESVVAEDASLPFFLADGDGLLLVQAAEGLRDFRVHEPTSPTLRPAREDELAGALAVLPHSRLKASYLLTRGFDGAGGRLDEPTAALGFEDLMMRGLQHAPSVLRDFRKLNGAMAETVVGLVDEGPEFFFSANHLTDEYIFVNEDDAAVAVGDRATRENFLRLLTGMTIPVIPNIPLRMAIHDSNLWQEEAYRQRFHRTVNELVAELTAAILDVVEGEAALPLLHRMVALNERRLAAFRHQAAAGHVLPERVLFAENTLAAARTDLEKAAGDLVVAQARVAGLLGRAPHHPLPIAPLALAAVPSAPPPSPEWFEAQGRINHPDLQRLDAMILRAAAIRDMGPPSTRNDGLKVRVTYGLGIDRWSEAVDDFISLSTDHVVPLRLPLLDNAYYDQWTGEIDHFRQEKFQVQGEIVAAIHAAHTDLAVLRGQLETRSRRRDFWRERLRVSRLYDRLGRLEHQQERDLFDSVNHELELLADERATLGFQAEYHRRLAKLYAASGIAVRLLPELFARLDGSPMSAARPVHGLYLWRSLEVVTDRDRRRDFLDLCTASQVNLVYCFVSRTPAKELYLQRHGPEFAYFLELCRRQGIRVVAMMGEPDWLEPDFGPEIQALLDSLEAFDRARVADGDTPFAGLKLDVEPHARPGWHEPEQRAALVAAYLALLDQVAARTGRDRLSADVPWNWQGLTVPGNDADLLQATAARVGRLTIMAYLNRPARMIDQTLPILRRDDLHIPVEIALETGPVDEPGVSYFGRPEADLLAALAAARDAYDGLPAFAGFVIHDYEHFRLMSGK